MADLIPDPDLTPKIGDYATGILSHRSTRAYGVLVSVTRGPPASFNLQGEQGLYTCEGVAQVVPDAQIVATKTWQHVEAVRRRLGIS